MSNRVLLNPVVTGIETVVSLIVPRPLIWLLAVATCPVAVWAQVKVAPPISGVLGKLDAVTSDSIEVQTKTGAVRVEIEQPFTTYQQVPSELRHVTSDSYVGIPSVEQANGMELAQQIMIFPKELRGAAEGSVLMDAAPGAATHSRMTNGSVSRPVSKSRMTNGTVQEGGGTTLVVRYQDGEQTISVPANVRVTEIEARKVPLVAGDTI